IKVVQERQELYFDIAYSEPVYRLHPWEHSFIIKTNAKWTATKISDPDDVVTFADINNGMPDEYGTVIKFTTKEKLVNAIKNSTVQIRFSSTSIPKEFPDKLLTLNLEGPKIVGKSNSYMLSPGKEAILIPVSQANADGTIRIDDNAAVYGEFLWSDSPNGWTGNGVVSHVGTVGIGSKAYIYVIPGNTPGNAVVAVRVNGTIAWSWHIWVSNSIPNVGVPSGTFMDRNLGATSNSPNNVNTLGLLYQWGRKDPFPGAGSTTQNVFKKIYNANGMEVSSPFMNSRTTVQGSVQNPLVYYGQNDGNSREWLLSPDNALWGGANTTTPSAKTAYDPCPEGWRVPAWRNGKSPWDGLSVTNFPWDNALLGRTSATHGGYYPAAGYRDSVNGLLGDVGGAGYAWIASPSGVYGYHLAFNSTVITSAGGHRANGIPVRCIRE
ncbi:hypothetical protein CMT37_18540, partial [Elizabethkingia anophelis]|nr:hypothetical protein [Elizabethkingia anophelis]